MRPSARETRCAVRPPGHRAGTRPLTTECPSLVSDHGGGGTPGPIPNPEVKPPSADGTAEWSVGEQDVADQRGAFACRGPRHPGGGGALLRMAGRGQTNGGIGQLEWSCGFKCGCDRAFISLAALSVSRCALAFWHDLSRFDASRDFKRPAGMLEGSGCRN